MDLYKSIDECKKATVTWYDEEKYKKNYHVLNTWQEIEQDILNTYKLPEHTDVKNEPIDPNGKYAKLLSEIKPKYYKQTKTAIRNSLYYMFHKYGSGGYYVRIRNGELSIFAYIFNNDWENPLSEQLHIYPKFAKKYIHSNKKKWPILGAMIRVYEKKYEGYGMDFYYSETKYLLQQICNKLPDCDFIVTNKDNLVIKKDLTEPCEEVVGRINEPLTSSLKFNEYCPLFSFSWNERYADMPLPTPDDVLRIYELYPAEKCKNLYINLPVVPWNEKIATAVFRGSYTGSSANIERNPRLHIAMINYKWKFNPRFNASNSVDHVRYLDAGLSSKGGFHRGRKEINDKYIRFVDDNYWEYMLVDPLSHEQQIRYKYVVYIEGNAAAYRGAFLFSMRSVVLWVKSSKYYCWFEPYLVDGVNCIMIEHNLSNLADKIKWLKQNDDKAEQIAIAGRALYDELFTKDAIESFAIQSICASL
jgi:hypothetical protein